MRRVLHRTGSGPGLAFDVRALSPLLRPAALAVATVLGGAPALAQSAATYSQRVEGNQEHVIILPSVSFAYETNTLPYGRTGTRSGSSGNGRITPGIDISINKLVGRVRLTVTGSAGYDINTRYKFLNQPRIGVSGGASVPVGGRCQVDLGVSYQQFRFSQTDINQNTDATSRQQTYDASGSCQRPVGFSPVAGVTYQKLTSDGLFDVFDSETFTYRGGIAYTRPSLGTLTLTGSIAEIDRPAVRRLTGIDDKTQIRQVQLSLSRAVSPRLQFSAGAGYVNADPDRRGVGGFSGLSFNGNVTYNLSPRFTLTGSASRNIDNENGISATYVRRDDYAASLSWRLTQPSAVTLSGRRTYRHFSGEDILNPSQPIGDDRVTQVSAYYTLDTFRRFRFTAGASHLWRHGANAIYDFQSTTFTASIGARF